MSFKLKVLAASLVAAISGQAAAALQSPTTNNGSLWLTVWDTSVGATKSYVRDLGLTINSFLPAGQGGDKTPEAPLTLNFAGDALFGSTFSGVNTANLLWNVVAADNIAGGANGQARLITTAVISTPNSPSITRAGNVGAGTKADTVATDLNANWGCGANASCAVTDPSAFGFGGGNNWGSQIGGQVPFNTSAGIGTALNFFYFASNSSAFGQADVKNVFANSFGRATWNLDSTGKVTYNLEGPAAVPVPAAVWLLGSGLVGMVGVARRRKDAA